MRRAQQRCVRVRRRGGFAEAGAKAFALVAVCFVTFSAEAEESAEDASPTMIVPGLPAGSGGGSGPGLDALLHVPKDYLQPKGRTVAGADEDEWRRRFAVAHRTLQRAQASLDETKGALDAAAGGSGSSQWAVAPPGASGSGPSPTDSPLSFKLRQEMLRNREGLDEAGRSLRDLRIEADLAGVPGDWRGDRKVPLGKRLPDSPYYN